MGVWRLLAVGVGKKWHGKRGWRGAFCRDTMLDALRARDRWFLEFYLDRAKPPAYSFSILCFISGGWATTNAVSLPVFPSISISKFYSAIPV